MITTALNSSAEMTAERKLDSPHYRVRLNKKRMINNESERMLTRTPEIQKQVKRKLKIAENP